MALVLEEQLVHLLVDGLLRRRGVEAGNFGQEADVVVDEGLPGHAELLPVGVQLALGQAISSGRIGLEFAVLRHQQEVTHAADDVLVVCSLLEVLQAPGGSEGLEGGGYMVVQVDDALADGLIQNGGEGCGGVVELAAQLRVEVIAAHAEQGAGVVLPVPHQAFDAQIAQAHALQLTCAGCGILHRHAGAPKQESVGGVSAEFILPGAGHLDAGGQGGAVRAELFEDRRPDLIHGGAVGDVVRRVDAEVPAHGGDVGDAGALCLDGSLGVSGGALRCGSALRGGASGLPLLGLIGGNLGGQGVDLPLQSVKFTLLLCGEGAVRRLGCVHQLLLASNFGGSLLLLVHSIYLLLLFRLI